MLLPNKQMLTPVLAYELPFGLDDDSVRQYEVRGVAVLTLWLGVPDDAARIFVRSVYTLLREPRCSPGFEIAAVALNMRSPLKSQGCPLRW